MCNWAFVWAQEAGLLKGNGEYYSELGKAMSKAGVSVDMFLFPTAYTDVATLGIYEHPRHTSCTTP